MFAGWWGERSGLVELMEVHAWTRRVGLEVENRDLHGFLLVAGRAGEAALEGVSDAEVNADQGGKCWQPFATANALSLFAILRHSLSDFPVKSIFA